MFDAADADGYTINVYHNGDTSTTTIDPEWYYSHPDDEEWTDSDENLIALRELFVGEGVRAWFLILHFS